jgi:hypothetical protein
VFCVLPMQEITDSRSLLEESVLMYQLVILSGTGKDWSVITHTVESFGAFTVIIVVEERWTCA